MKKNRKAPNASKGTRAVVRLAGMRKEEPSDVGAHASAGRTGSARTAKRAKQLQMGGASVRGSGSSGEQRGTTLGMRAGRRGAGSKSAGTIKSGSRRGARSKRV